MPENDVVTIRCYGKLETKLRDVAIREYVEAVAACEGSEKNRYSTILAQLVNGDEYCTDFDGLEG